MKPANLVDVQAAIRAAKSPIFAAIDACIASERELQAERETKYRKARNLLWWAVGKMREIEEGES